MIKLPTKNTIQGFDIGFEEGRFFLTNYEKGEIHEYFISTPITPQSMISVRRAWKGAPYPNYVKYWAERDELYVGYRAGALLTFDLDANPPIPVCNKKTQKAN